MMLTRSAKDIIKSSLHSAGIEIRKNKENTVFDLTTTGCLHPIEAAYAARGKPLLITAPLSRMVTFNYSAFSLDPDDGHPFLATLLQYENDRSIPLELSPLCRYYALYQPKSASELMDIDNPSHADFNRLPALAAIPLWASRPPADQAAFLKDIYRKEDEAQGIHTGEFIGGSEYGPIERRKLAMEYGRLTALYDSIKEHGYSPEKCDRITGTVWANDDDWTISISTGQHRIACLAALGYESATVYLQETKAPGGILLRSCARHFPSVARGFHTEEEAIRIFDRISRKRPPRVASEWLSYCQRNR
ncbi:hypothetical protein [Halomonas maura]|uniref:hypothetical protein n=1 Tax=Halomonas maura TaxID=117606 RepID=UPI0025B5F926|nr:hypothetical protein [Halomonas maura]MDN3554855.1 hypothetical protein [Halomonas maura]